MSGSVSMIDEALCVFVIFQSPRLPQLLRGTLAFFLPNFGIRSLSPLLIAFNLNHASGGVPPPSSPCRPCTLLVHIGKANGISLISTSRPTPNPDCSHSCPAARSIEFYNQTETFHCHWSSQWYWRERTLLRRRGTGQYSSAR
jgi:hypothetical protein